MNYIYHRKRNIVGDTLYALNELKNTLPDVYEKQAKKYEGREWVTEQKIPKLNCLWNDVLHFSAVHPKYVKEALKNIGFDYNWDDWYFYEIDPNTLEPEKTVVYLYSQEFLNDKFNEKNWADYNPKDLEKYSILPEETKEYYKESFQNDKDPLLWHLVPHILYKGSLDLKNIKVLKI